MTAPVLEVKEIHKSYGLFEAVKSVSFSVGLGEIVGLLGPNGAGKTTLISMVLGVLEPSSGTIQIHDRLITPTRRETLQNVNFAAVYAPLPGNLTVLQNLRVFALLYALKNASDRIEEVLERFDLERFRNTKCGLLSSGEQTRASLAKAMLNKPRLLLLDEPTASLDPSAARDLRDLIQDLVKDEACGVLWTSHNMHEVESVCHRVIFLSRGKILVQGDPKALPARYGKANLEELFIELAEEPLEPKAL